MRKQVEHIKAILRKYTYVDCHRDLLLLSRSVCADFCLHVSAFGTVVSDGICFGFKVVHWRRERRKDEIRQAPKIRFETVNLASETQHLRYSDWIPGVFYAPCVLLFRKCALLMHRILQNNNATNATCLRKHPILAATNSLIYRWGSCICSGTVASVKMINLKYVNRLCVQCFEGFWFKIHTCTSYNRPMPRLKTIASVLRIVMPLLPSSLSRPYIMEIDI